MKAREIKKKLMESYEDKIREYKGTVSFNVREMAVSQAKIKQLEIILFECFGIEKEFNFNFAYEYEHNKIT